MAVVVTVAKGYDLGYVWKTQDRAAERVIGGYYLNAARAGEPPGRWRGPGAQALGAYASIQFRALRQFFNGWPPRKSSPTRWPGSAHPGWQCQRDLSGSASWPPLVLRWSA